MDPVFSSQISLTQLMEDPLDPSTSPALDDSPLELLRAEIRNHVHVIREDIKQHVSAEINALRNEMRQLHGAINNLRSPPAVTTTTTTTTHKSPSPYMSSPELPSDSLLAKQMSKYPSPLSNSEKLLRARQVIRDGIFARRLSQDAYDI